jgi:hypothetical protein
METKVTTISYNLDDAGNAQSITVVISGYENKESLSATVIVVDTDLETGKTFDDLTRKEIESIARGKTATYAQGVNGTIEASEPTDTK